MPCCGGRSCTCKLEAGLGVVITGGGSVDEPYVISSDAGAVQITDNDNAVFNVGIAGDGTDEDPFEISVQFAGTAKLDNIPDVNAPTPTNGQVLAWHNASGTWRAADPVTAPVGSVDHDDTLSGDGSSGDPLSVVTDDTRGVTDNANGVALTNATINQGIRKFANNSARNAADPSAEVLNTFTVLATSPGVLWYWSGTAWVQQVAGGQLEMPFGTEVMLTLSGPWDSSMPVRHIVKKVDATANADGEFTIFSTVELAGMGGVIVARYQSNNQHPPFFPVVFGDTNRIRCTGFQLGSNNTPIDNGTVVFGFAEAWVY